ncbi:MULTISPECIES: zinc-binding dehydrogenase [Sorangium]|uniref:zinc-binding dehydrogenase n=1 Tax=Sorangium TaxID=39643 RepID=UPI003D9C1386
MAMKCAWLRGAARVIGVDLEEYRLEKAHEVASAETVNVESGVALEFIRTATYGRGADIRIDAVGMEAHRTPLENISNLVHGQSASARLLSTSMWTSSSGGSRSASSAPTTSSRTSFRSQRQPGDTASAMRRRKAA